MTPNQATEQTKIGVSARRIAIRPPASAENPIVRGALKSIQASWSVLRQFPKQVIVLKGTRETGMIAPEAAGMANRMILQSETKGIEKFVGLLDLAAAGNRSIQRQLLQRGKWADDHMANMLNKADKMDISITEFSDVFTEAELGRIRREDTWTQEMIDKFLDLTTHLTEHSFSQHPDKPRWPKGAKHLVNHFLFRHTLTYLIYMLRLIQRGAKNRKPNKARNDAIDVIFASYATYFNGLMSMDDEASAIHAISRGLLLQAGARVPEDYLEKYVEEIAAQMPDLSSGPT